jgi:hypothetical protein
MHEEARAVWGFFVFRPTWPIEILKTAVWTTQASVKKIGQWAIVTINVLAVAFIFLALPVMGTMLAIELGGEFLKNQSRAASQKYAQESVAQRSKDIESFNNAISSQIEQIKLLAKLDKAWESSSPAQRSTWAAYNHVLPEVQSWLGRNNKPLDPGWYKNLKK